MNEKMAAERYGGEVRVGKYPSGRNHRALAMHNPMGFVKLVVPPEGDDRVLGVRAIGRDSDTVAGIVSMMIENKLPYTLPSEFHPTSPILVRVSAGRCPDH